MRKNILLYMLSIVIGITSITIPTTDVWAANNMKVVGYEGQVTLNNSKGKSKAIKNGTRLLSGDTIITKKQSTADVLLDNTKAALVEESSQVSIKQSGKDLDMIIDNGSVFFDVSKKLTSKESFEIKTSNMVCGIRGTIGEVKTIYNKKKKTIKTQIYLLEGKAKIVYNANKKKKKEKNIIAGKKVTLSTNIKNGKCNASVTAIKSTDITTPVAEKLQNDEKLLARVEKSCKQIDWDKTIADAMADSGIGLRAPRITGSVTDNSIKTVYDCISFGNYWQEDTNGDGVADKNDAKTAIKWRVLSVNNDKALILSDQILDCQRYFDGFENTTWEDSIIREWLNHEFLNNAFSEAEQKAVIETKIENKDNQFDKTVGGNATNDKIFLLSLEEISNPDYGFTNFEIPSGLGHPVGRIGDNPVYGVEIYDYSKLRTVTSFAKGPSTASGSFGSSRINTNEWWLRSPGEDSRLAVTVSESGAVGQHGRFVYADNFGVVPAMYIDLSSSSWTKAGSVSCIAGVHSNYEDAVKITEN